MWLKCPYCQYTWAPRCPSPKCCPYCTRYFTDENKPSPIEVPEPRAFFYRGKVVDGICSSCGVEGRVVEIGLERYCKDCIANLLGEQNE